ncbi:mechanosensitive ion channel family protein [Microbacterium sp.]|uniref:mechanosensitive ion channel family protein n=1 Tax=Microbacterium sp. TaxID=51671 RepID=UPI0037C69FC0
MSIRPLSAADPSFWERVGQIVADAGGKLIWTAVIIVVCLLLAWLLRFVIRRVVNRIVSGAKSKANVDDTRAIDASPLAKVRIIQRTRTLGTILQNITNVALVVIAIVLIVNVFAPSVLGSLTLLTAAVGAGLGFGAQNIVKDVLNGIFIVAEDQVGIGDVVDVGLATGIVEYVSIRITHVRDVNGTLWYVRNGEITRIGNMSQGWSRVIVDLSLPVEVDVDEVEAALLATAVELQNDPKWRSRILEKPEVWGLESIDGDALIIRLVMKTRANARDDVARELRMRIKRTADSLGVPLPALATVTPTGIEGARRVRGANPPKTKPQPVTPPPERPSWRPRKGKGDREKDAE